MTSAFISGGLSALVITAGCSANGASGTPSGPQRAAEPVPVAVGTVTQKTVPVQLSVVGTVEPYSTVTVRPQVSGELVRVNFQQGQDVHKGELLFTIDPRPLESALKLAEANLAKDTAQQQNADQQVRRYSDLVKRGIGTREQLDQMQTNAAALHASVEADHAAIDNAKLQLAYTSMRSPVEGRTGTLLVHEGNVVTANQTELVVINQIRPVYVTFSVPEQYLAEVKPFTGGGKLGVRATIPNDSGQPEQGTLTFVENTVDASTGTVRLRGTFANPKQRLWPGQYVDVLLTLSAQPNAIVVASQAVQTGQTGQYVFVVKPDMTVESRSVTVQRTVGNDAIIAEGLRLGERVVTDGHLRLVPGSKIEIKNAPGTVG